MAFAAVSCLIETLEDLLRFTFLALEIKGLQTTFISYEPTNKFVRDSLGNFLMPWHLMIPRYMIFTPRSPEKTGDGSSEFDEYIFSSNMCLYLLRRRAKDISDLWLGLPILLTVLRDSNTICHDREKMQYLERSLIDLAYRIEDAVEETVIDHSIIPKAFSFINVVVNEDPMSVMGNLTFMTQVFDMFDERCGLQISLQQALTEISLIMGEMKMIYDGTPIVIADQQSDHRSVVVDSLQHMTTKKNQVFNADDDFMSILDRVIRDSSPLELVAIVGMGGIGKTTLAQRIFDYPLTCHHFYIRAWVVVSQVYQVRDILTGILSCISQVTDEICGKSNGQLAEMVWRSLKGKRFLIVLDNIWSTKAWDDIKRCFPDDKNGSRLVLTTRQMKVANYVNPRQLPHFVNLLDKEQSWKLLQWKVFGEEPCPSELEDVGRRIARKCQGLPLVIVVIAGILLKMKRTCDCWQDIAESVNSVVSSDPEQCLEILALSYNHLPNHLKACFLYMGAFPEDCEIEVQKLIRLWIAEGFLDKKLDAHASDQLPESKSRQLLWYKTFLDNKFDRYVTDRSWASKYQPFNLLYRSKSNLEIEAETYLKDLIERNLLLVGKRTFSGEIRTCRLHEVMQDLCIREAQKENFMHVIRMDSEAHSASMINPRRLSLQSSSWGNLHSLPSPKLVRSFLCFSLGFAVQFGNLHSDTIFFQVRFKLLRVLDIIFLHFQSFPDLILQLVHLRYLAFTATYELPVSISELKNLQTLIIRGPWIPDEFGDSPVLLLEYWNMPWLRHLHTTVACYLRNPFILKNDLRTPFYPRHLQSLSFIMFSSCSPEVFSLMPHIKKLGIFESEDDYKTDASSNWLRSLVHLNQLEELKCSFHAQNRSPRNNLHWLFPSSLKKLTLSWSYVPWENMTPVTMLPELEVLKLKNHAFVGLEWEPSAEGFRCLKHLLIENHNLEHLEASRVHFPRLEHLALRSCRSLEEISFGIAEIPTLQLIELHYCGESAENSAKEIQEQIDGLNVDIRTDRS